LKKELFKRQAFEASAEGLKDACCYRSIHWAARAQSLGRAVKSEEPHLIFY
jgi:hypothetical protein